MPAPETVALFALASLALIAFPGPSVFYILARSFEGGRRAGMVSMLGVETGAWCTWPPRSWACRRCWPPRPWPSAWSSTRARRI